MYSHNSNISTGPIQPSTGYSPRHSKNRTRRRVAAGSSPLQLTLPRIKPTGQVASAILTLHDRAQQHNLWYLADLCAQQLAKLEEGVNAW